MKNIDKSILVSMVFSLILFVSGFGRYSNIFITDEIPYPKIVDFLMANSREIVGLLLLIFYLYLFNKYRGKFFVSMVVIVPIVIFHFFLSVKLLFNENPDWNRNILGAFLIIGIYRVFYEHLLLHLKSKAFDSSIKLVIAGWIVTVFYIYITTGIDSLVWNDRYFFFSAHQNHAGALWAFSSIYLASAIALQKNRFNFIELGMLLISASFLVATGSRGAMVAFIIGLCCLLATTKSKYLPILFAVIGVVGVSIAGSDFVVDFLANQIGRGNSRAGTYSDAIESFLSYPWFGETIADGRAIFVENTPLAFIQTGGLVGLVLVSIFYLVLLIKLTKSYKLVQDKKILYVFLPMIFTGIAASFIEAYPLNFLTTGLFMLLLPTVFIEHWREFLTPESK